VALGGFAQAVLELLPLRQEVPVEVAVHAADGVGEAVALLQREPPVAQRPEHGPAAFGAEVEGEKIVCRHRRPW
jgi:hypothetical protein